VYSSWINSCIPSKVTNLKQDLKDGSILCQVIDIITGSRLSSTDKREEHNDDLTQAINFIKEKGIEVNDDCMEEISQGDLKAILDLLWLIILNFDIHNHNRAAYQRSVSMGKRFLLEWIARELPDVILDPKGNFVESFQNGFLLSRVVAKHCPMNDVMINRPEKTLDSDDIKVFLDAADSHLGVPSSILSTKSLRSGKIDEYTLLIYLAILRRKVCEKKGEELYRGGGSPIKHSTPQTTPVKSHVVGLKTPPAGLNGQSPLSPATLKKLIDQQTKSHEAIQALQAKLQSINYHPFTPKLLKQSLPRIGPPQEMPSVYGMSCEAGRRHSHPGIIDFNADSSMTDTSPDIESIYNQSFFGSMLDAVQGYMLPKVSPKKPGIKSEIEETSVPDATPNDDESSGAVEVSRKELELPSKPEEESISDVSAQLKDDQPQSEYTSTAQEMTNGCSEEAINCEVNEPTTIPADNSLNTAAGEQTCQEQSSTINSTTRPCKHVQFSGLDIVFAEANDSESPNSTISETISPNTSSSVKELSFCENDEQGIQMEETTALAEREADVAATCKETVTSASLSSSSPGPDVNGHDYGPPDSSIIFDEENDQFMMYLNSIEQTALKFKLQVEQAKIDTLQMLKKRLEQAYEGTPLEEIPAKVHERLQETIAQIATEEVKKYESVLNASCGDDFDEDECGILQQMRAELDSLSAENCRLSRELEDMKKYEKEYHELQKKIEGMEDGLTTMKHDYATKNGESEFLGKRIEALEHEMTSMHVEYEDQIRELQNQNIELQKECLELDNENRALEDEIRRIQVGLSDRTTDEEIYRVQSDDYLAERITAAELEAVEIRVNELERHNKALKAAGEADHAVVVCLEKKVEELEGSLNEAKSTNSDLLTELHESQRQQASDRAKLSSYREELEALKHENRVLKCGLESAENEVQYQKRKNDRKKTETLTRSPASLGNKREIWNEIRELETILNDVQKEKQTIEKKYKAFRKDSNEKTNTPRGSTFNLHSPSCHSPASTKSSPESTLARPRRTSSLLERVNRLLEKSSLPNGASTGSLSTPSRNHVANALDKDAGKSTTGRPNIEKPTANGGPNELSSLRNHVGSLEAEKASILLELSHLRTPKKDK
ncbi:hypothetical protein QZH41_011990, partial [Actinostola sp. cb2023]